MSAQNGKNEVKELNLKISHSRFKSFSGSISRDNRQGNP